MHKPILAAGVLLALGLATLVRIGQNDPPPPPEEGRADEPGRGEFILRLEALGRDLPSEVTAQWSDLRRIFRVQVAGDRRHGYVLVPRELNGREVVVSARGFLEAKATLEADSAAELTLMAPAVVTFTGLEAALRIHSAELLEDDGTVAARVALRDGERTIGGLRGGKYEITLLDEDHEQILRLDLELACGCTRTVDVSALEARPPLVLSLQDEVGSTSADAEVRGLAESRERVLASTVTDAEGRANIQIAPGRYSLVITCPGFLSFDGALDLDARQPALLTLRRSRAVTVRVTTENNTPVMGCEVDFITTTEGDNLHTVLVSDEKGRIELPRGEGSEPLPVYARKDGYAHTWSMIDVHDPDPVIVLRAIANVTLEVVDRASGAAVPTASLRLLVGTENDDPEATYVHRQAFTAVEPGIWRLSALASGQRASVRVSASGYEDAEVSFSARPGLRLRVELEHGDGVTLSGRALREDGTPVRAWVSATPNRGSALRLRRDGSDSNGAFEIEGLEAGTAYRIAASSFDQKYVAPPQELRPESSGKLDLLFLRAGTLTGTVRSSRSDCELRRLGIQVESIILDNGTEVAGVRELRMVDPGRLAVGGFYPGVYSLILRSGGHIPLRLPGVRIRSGEITDIGSVLLDPAARVEVRVRLPRGIEADDARVHAIGESGQVHRLSPLRDRPSRHKGYLDSGTYRLLLESSSTGPTLLGSQRVVAGEEYVLELEGRPPGRLRILVRTSTGRPAPWTEVEILSKAPSPFDRLLVLGLREDLWWKTLTEVPDRLWPMRTLRTDADGWLITGPLQPGDYEVISDAASTTETVSEGETMVVSLTMR